MKSRAVVMWPFLLSSFLLGRTDGKIPLQKAIEAGLRTDFAYLNTLLDQQKAGMQQELAAKNKLFHIHFDASYLYRSETMIIEFPAVAVPGTGSLPGERLEAGLKNNFDFRLSLTQPIYTGGILTHGVKLAEVQKAAEADQESLKKNEIAGLIKSSFFQFLLLERKRASLMTLEEALALHRRRLEDLYQEELVRKTDLLETLSGIQEIQLQIQDVETAMEAEKIHFFRLCGFYPEDIDDSYREPPLSRDAALAYFEESHPILNSLKNQSDMLSLKRKIAGGRYLPQISGFAEVHYGKPGIDYFKKEWTLYFQGGVMLSLPVFDWNRLRGEKTVLDYQLQQLENQKLQFIRDVTRSLEQLFTTLHKLEEKKAHVDLLIGYSEEDAELKAALYSEKQIPNVDYLTSILSREKHALLKEEIQIQIEQLKVRISTLIARNEEDSDV